MVVESIVGSDHYYTKPPPQGEVSLTRMPLIRALLPFQNDWSLLSLSRGHAP